VNAFENGRFLDLWGGAAGGSGSSRQQGASSNAQAAASSTEEEASRTADISVPATAAGDIEAGTDGDTAAAAADGVYSAATQIVVTTDASPPATARTRDAHSDSFAALQRIQLFALYTRQLDDLRSGMLARPEKRSTSINIGLWGVHESTYHYSDLFYSYIQQGRRCYFGCDGLIFPKGLRLGVWRFRFTLTPGIFEDYLVYVCNNHTIISCVYSIKGGTFSRAARKIVWLCQHVFAFTLVSFTTEILSYFDAPPNAAPLFNIFVVTPVSVLLNKTFMTIYTSDYVRQRGRVLVTILLLAIVGGCWCSAPCPAAARTSTGCCGSTL
jgi:hypothetical protein